MYSILLAAGWPIWPLLAISIVGLAILIERAWYLRKKHIIRKETIDQAFSATVQDGANSEFLGALSTSSPIGTLLAGALREHAMGHSADTAMEELQILAQNLWAKLDRHLDCALQHRIWFIDCHSCTSWLENIAGYRRSAPARMRRMYASAL